MRHKPFMERNLQAFPRIIVRIKIKKARGHDGTTARGHEGTKRREEKK